MNMSALFVTSFFARLSDYLRCNLNGHAYEWIHNSHVSAELNLVHHHASHGLGKYCRVTHYRDNRPTHEPVKWLQLYDNLAANGKQTIDSSS